MRIPRNGSIPFGILLLLTSGQLAAQMVSESALQVDDKPTPKILLGTASGPPGATVTMPITFIAGEGNHIRRLKLTVTFQSAHVEFEKLERGEDIDPQELEVILEDHVTSGEGRAETSILTIRVATVSDGPDDTGIPSGVLGNLTFRIEDDSDGTIVNVFTSVAATETGAVSALPSRRIHVTEGAIFVLAPGFDTLPE